MLTNVIKYVTIIILKEVIKIAVSEKIKALLKLKGKKSYELAEYLGMSPQAMRNKFSRNSFSSADLIKISEFLGCELVFIAGENQIRLEMSDLKNNE